MATFTNQASLTFNGKTITSNITTGEIVDVLTATKTPIEADYSNNSKVTYAVNIVNAGNTEYSNLTLTDNLGAYTLSSTSIVPLQYVSGSVKYFNDGELQTTPVPTATNPLTITGINVPANGNTLIIYSADVNQYAPLATGSTITNTATISGSSLSSSITAQATIDAAAEPNLSINKSLCPTKVTENGQVVYTITIENTGNTAITAADGVVISDTFDPVLSSISVSLNGTTLPTSDYTYSSKTGAFATEAGIITVPAATYTQNATTGAYSITPGIATLEITGTI